MSVSVLHLIEKRLKILPWYVREFIEHKSRTSSENTLLGYVQDYEIFFAWLKDRGFHDGEPITTDLKTLEVLRKKDIVSFENFCSKHLGNSTDTIARKISSLKSLFHYLSQIAEDDDFYPYLKRNVLAKIEIVRVKRTDTEISEHISSRILVEEEIAEFREFVATGYGELIKDDKRKFNYYLRNRERDLAIVSLILGSGMRVSEVVSLDIDKIDWNKEHVLIRRKGGKFDRVVFSETALLDLLEYRKVRDERYKVDKSEKALFLSIPSGNGKSGRLTKNSAQKMVDKFAEAFGKGDLSIHKLRHTFATQHYSVNKDINALKRQMGHSDINTTTIYTHVFDETLKDSVNRSDK